MPDVLLIKRFHKTTINVDGRQVRVLVDRLTVEQLAAFSRDLTLHDSPATVRAVSVRHPGEEMDRRPAEADGGEGAFVISDDEIQARRLGEMTPAQREAWTKAHIDDTASAAAFLRRAAAHVHLEPGQVQVEQADGSRRDVAEAVDLIDLFGSPALGRSVIRAVWAENTLPSAVKNIYRSLHDSGGTSVVHGLAAAGGAPEATAAHVDEKASVMSAVATASTAAARSGSTKGSSLRRARSLRSRPRSSRQPVGLR